MSDIRTIHTLKSVREALCFISTTNLKEGDQATKYQRVIADLVSDIDRQRPLGSNGKHGNLHTKHCGCDGIKDPRDTWRGDPNRTFIAGIAIGVAAMIAGILFAVLVIL